MVKSSKNRNMRYYRAVSTIMVGSKEACIKSKNSKFLSFSSRKIMKFSAIGIASLSSWPTATYMDLGDDVWHLAEDKQIMPVADLFAPAVAGLSVVAAGLAQERILTALTSNLHNSCVRLSLV